MILLDTNVLSEWMKPDPAPAVIGWLDRQNQSQVFICAVTRAEIETGIALLPVGTRRAKLRAAANVLLGELADRCLPLCCDCAIHYATIIEQSKRLGRPITVEDAQIAAIARQHAATLATRNIRDFDFLEGLSLVNPWA
jgi:predicted nucleic acid-binding protein